MEREKKLTNELISKRYKSQFDLVNHAIRLAAHHIQAGHEPSVGSADNIVNDVLNDIALGRDTYEDWEEEEEAAEETIIEIEEEVAPAKKSRSRAKEVAKRV
jgi:hypothetical protein